MLVRYFCLQEYPRCCHVTMGNKEGSSNQETGALLSSLVSSYRPWSMTSLENLFCTIWRTLWNGRLVSEPHHLRIVTSFLITCTEGAQAAHHANVVTFGTALLPAFLMEGWGDGWNRQGLKEQQSPGQVKWEAASWMRWADDGTSYGSGSPSSIAVLLQGRLWPLASHSAQSEGEGKRTEAALPWIDK